VSFGVGVERTFPVHSPSIAKLEVGTRGKVRRAKLYYLRELRGKKARIRERRVGPEELAAAQSISAEGTLEGTTEQPGAVEVFADGAEAAGAGSAAATDADQEARTEPMEVAETAAVEAESKD
jgi:hypothetical protein